LRTLEQHDEKATSRLLAEHMKDFVEHIQGQLACEFLNLTIKSSMEICNESVSK